MAESIENLSPIQRSLLVIEGLKSKIKKLEDLNNESIAIIGLSCRFPGNVTSPEEFWDLLSNGVDAIDEIPNTRWDVNAFFDTNPDIPRKSYSKSGGFLNDIDHFDPMFFNITPREAMSIDPQYRLLLECSYEALERANLSIPDLKGSQTGVFMGITLNDYGKVIKDSQVKYDIEPYSITGLLLNAGSGRISYTFGFVGPSMAIDTACSSSLVAIHQACQSLKMNECNMALAGGVNLILTPDTMIGTSKAKILSADGHCKTFDESADGIGRAEGCGIIILKRLSDAIANNDSVLAVIRGSAVNQDGASSGFTVPSSSSQQALIRQALKMGKIKSNEVDYIEAHGTGTPLGDPIELRSLYNVFGKDIERKNPLIIGSVKTNIGHAESASGIAGVIKVILQLQNKKLVPHLNLKNRTSKFNWDDFPVAIPTQLTEWESNGKKRIAGISSFGATGTNGHVIIEEAPENNGFIEAEKSNGSHLFCISAKSNDALNEMIIRYQDFLQTNSNIDIANVCYSANVSRSHYNFRLAAVASNTIELVHALETYKTDRKNNVNNIRQFTGKIVFLFTGQGSQYIHMGQDLFGKEPVFRQAIEQCSAILHSSLEYSLIDILFPPSANHVCANLINETQYAQPAIVAIEYALVKLWESWGVIPKVVCGHSIGEYTAAIVSGIMELDDCLKLIALRGKLMQSLPLNGSMVSVNINKSEIQKIIQPFKENVSVAAINGPASTVISGSSQSLATICDNLKLNGYNTTYLNVSHAFHSPLMQSILEEFNAFAQSLSYKKPQIPFISNMTGNQEDHLVSKADYWVKHIVEPVNFEKGIQFISMKENNIFIEIGSKPILISLGQQFIQIDSCHWIASLRPKYNDQLQMLSGLGDLYTRGVKVDLTGVHKSYHPKKVILPTYPFQRQMYKIEANDIESSSVQILSNTKNHPFIGQRITPSGTRDIIFQSEWNSDFPAYIKEHLLFHKMVVPGASHVSMLLSAFKEISECPAYVFEDIYFTETLVFTNQSKRTVEVVLDKHTSNSSAFKIQSFHSDKDSKIKKDLKSHSIGKMLFRSTLNNLFVNNQSIRSEEVKTRCTNHLTRDEFYDVMWKADYHLGESFRWLKQIWHSNCEAIGKLELPNLPDDLSNYELYPGLIDSCFQMAGITAEQDKIKKMEKEDYIFVPFHIERFSLLKKPVNTDLWCHCTINSEKSNDLVCACDLSLMDELGEKIAEIIGLEVRKAPKAILLKSLSDNQDSIFYEIKWLQKPLQLPDGNIEKVSKWLVFGNHEEVLNSFADHLKSKKQEYILVSNSSNYLKLDEHRYLVDTSSVQQVQQLMNQLTGIDSIVLLFNNKQKNGQADLVDINKANEASCSLLHFIQAILSKAAKPIPKVCIVTNGTQYIHSVKEVNCPQSAPLWGIGKVLSIEHPELACSLIDFDAEIHTNQLVTFIYNELLVMDKEYLVAYRKGLRYVSRLEKYFAEPQPQKKVYPLSDTSSYLITGGLGALGLEFAELLASRGAKKIILTSRSIVSEKAKEIIANIQKMGVSVQAIQNDCSNEKDVESLIAAINMTEFPLKGIIHAAGVIDDAPIELLNKNRLFEVLAPKVGGSWFLHKHSENIKLDFFICISSMSALIGNHSQSNYAAANAFMDSLVAYRQGKGLSGLSINWGPWDKIGMAARIGDKYKNLIEKSGIRFINPLLAKESLALLLSDTKINVGVFDIDWDIYKQKIYANNNGTFLEKFCSVSNTEQIEVETYLTMLANITPNEQPTFILDVVTKEIARIIKTDALSIDVNESISTLGVDSLMAMEFRTSLQRKLNIDIPIGKLMEGGSIADLSNGINDSLLEWTMDSITMNQNIAQTIQKEEVFIEGEL